MIPARYRNCPYHEEFVRLGEMARCPADCKYRLVCGEREFCIYTPPRCGLHEIIKSQTGSDDLTDRRRCIFCDHYHKSIHSETCASCLQTKALINFKPQRIGRLLVGSEDEYTADGFLKSTEPHTLSEYDTRRRQRT